MDNKDLAEIIQMAFAAGFKFADDIHHNKLGNNLEELKAEAVRRTAEIMVHFVTIHDTSSPTN